MLKESGSDNDDEYEGLNEYEFMPDEEEHEDEIDVTYNALATLGVMRVFSFYLLKY